MKVGTGSFENLCSSEKIFLPKYYTTNGVDGLAIEDPIAGQEEELYSRKKDIFHFGGLQGKLYGPPLRRT